MTRALSISVVVPFHGRPEQVIDCLQALAGSTHQSFEVILVDDGSTEAAEEPADPRIDLVRIDTRSGPAVARNVGARRARGDLLVFIDSDVTVLPTTLEQIQARFDGDPSIDAVQAVYLHELDGANVPSRFFEDFQEYKNHGLPSPWVKTLRSGSVGIRRATFEKLGGFDEGFTRPSQEDVELGHRLSQAGHRIFFDREIRVRHHRVFSSAWQFLRRDFRMFKDYAKLRLRLLTGSRTGGTSTGGPTMAMSRAIQGWPLLVSLLMVSVVWASVLFVPLGMPRAFTLAALGGYLGFIASNVGFLVFLKRSGRSWTDLAGEGVLLFLRNSVLLLAGACGVVEFPFRRY